MSGSEGALAALQQALRALGSDLKDGRDAAPARRYRLEGALQLALDLDLLAEAQLDTWLGEAGLNRMESAGEHLCLELIMARAPVEPSTSDQKE